MYCNEQQQTQPSESRESKAAYETKMESTRRRITTEQMHRRKAPDCLSEEDVSVSKIIFLSTS
jgi:hypothetical protein